MGVKLTLSCNGIFCENSVFYQKGNGSSICERLYAGTAPLLFRRRKKAESTLSFEAPWQLLPDTGGIMVQYPAPFVKLTR